MKLLQKNYKVALLFLDSSITERHMLLKSTIGTLTMEEEAFQLSLFMASVFYLIFIAVGIVQISLICLYFEKYHPFNEILKGAEKKGKYIVQRVLL